MADDVTIVGGEFCASVDDTETKSTTFGSLLIRWWLEAVGENQLLILSSRFPDEEPTLARVGDTDID